MANTTLRIKSTTNRNDTAATFTTQGGPSAWYLRKLSSIFGTFSNGAWNSNTAVTVTCVAATGTVTFSSVVQNDTVTIAGTVFTGKDAPSTNVQFLTGSTDTASAASLAAKINAHTTINKYVSATSAAAIVTLTCVVPGAIGNLVSLAISAHGSVSAALMSGGSEGTTNTFAHGI